MTLSVLILFPMAVALAAVLAQITLWSPRRVWIKVTALAVTTLFFPFAYLSLDSLLSRPKPVGLEWAQENLVEAEVLAARMEEDTAIYLWLALTDAEEPRAYVLPWDEQTARQLHAAQRGAEQQGTGVKIRRQSQESGQDNQQPMFYAEPQPAPPPKQQAGSRVEVFRGNRQIP